MIRLLVIAIYIAILCYPSSLRSLYTIVAAALNNLAAEGWGAQAFEGRSSAPPSCTCIRTHPAAQEPWQGISSLCPYFSCLSLKQLPHAEHLCVIAVAAWDNKLLLAHLHEDRNDAWF